jgi:hypothetical protein
LDEYQKRLADTTIAVDRYARDAPVTEERSAMEMALNAYSLAHTSWRVAALGGYAGDYRRLHGNPALACPSLIALSEQRAKEGAAGPARDPAWTVNVGHGTQALWACAADKLAEAEKLLGATKQ